MQDSSDGWVNFKLLSRKLTKNVGMMCEKVFMCTVHVEYCSRSLKLDNFLGSGRKRELFCKFSSLDMNDMSLTKFGRGIIKVSV